MGLETLNQGYIPELNLHMVLSSVSRCRPWLEQDKCMCLTVGQMRP